MLWRGSRYWLRLFFLVFLFLGRFFSLIVGFSVGFWRVSVKFLGFLRYRKGGRLFKEWV